MSTNPGQDQLEDTQIEETLVRDLAGGDFLAQQRNVVLIGGTGTGNKSWRFKTRA